MSRHTFLVRDSPPSSIEMSKLVDLVDDGISHQQVRVLVINTLTHDTLQLGVLSTAGPPSHTVTRSSLAGWNQEQYLWSKRHPHCIVTTPPERAPLIPLPQLVPPHQPSGLEPAEIVWIGLPIRALSTLL